MKNTYRKNYINRSDLKSTEITEGITIETQVALYLNNQVDGSETKELIYTERKDGVNLGTDVRTDKFDIAIEATNTASKSAIAKRLAKLTVVKKEEEDGKTESSQGTEN